MSDNPQDFEVAALAEWSEHCGHQDYAEVGGARPGQRFDFRAQFERYEAKVRPGAEAPYWGCSSNGQSQMCVAGLKAGQDAFVQVDSVSDSVAYAHPLVYLIESIEPPAFVASELYKAERLVYLSFSSQKVSVITTQRILGFDYGRLSGWIPLKDAVVLSLDRGIIIRGKDERGWQTALEFGKLASPASIEKLILGLKEISGGIAAETREDPERAVFDFFGQPVLDEIFSAVRARPGSTAESVSKATGLNRYLCRVMLRRLYLEGKVAQRDRMFYVAENTEARPVIEPSQASNAYDMQPAVPAAAPSPVFDDADTTSKAIEDLTDFAYKLATEQNELAKQIGQLHTEMQIVSSGYARKEDLADLTLHHARLDAELSSVLAKLDAFDSESQANIQSLRERTEWAEKAHAKLSWASNVIRDKAQKTIRDFEKASKASKRRAKLKKKK